MQEGGPLPGPESELLSNSRLTLGKELSKEVHMLTKQEMLLGKGASAEGSRVREPKRTSVSGFMVIGLVSGFFWPIILTQGPCWWCTRRSARINASEKDSGKW